MTGMFMYYCRHRKNAVTGMFVYYCRHRKIHLMTRVISRYGTRRTGTAHLHHHLRRSSIQTNSTCSKYWARAALARYNIWHKLLCRFAKWENKIYAWHSNKTYLILYMLMQTLILQGSNQINYKAICIQSNLVYTAKFLISSNRTTR